MLPEARVSHRTPGRLRIKIASRKGDLDFFAKLQKSFQRKLKFQEIHTNAVTGSVLIQDPDIDIGVISEHADEYNFFSLQDTAAEKVPLARSLMMPVQEMDRKIKRFTADEVDVFGVTFILLCLFGIYELLRGNFRTPPWYTAFWYAFGIFTKSMVDRSGNNG
jgi:hypothetical protein